MLLESLKPWLPDYPPYGWSLLEVSPLTVAMCGALDRKGHGAQVALTQVGRVLGSPTGFSSNGPRGATTVSWVPPPPCL